MISGCSIERVDGNGVMVSGYNRNATMKHNEISYVGGNAFAACEPPQYRCRLGCILLKDDSDSIQFNLM